MTPRNDEAIVVRGARMHNLKSVSLAIPRDKLVVLTGPSGSGKSSLAFDTIYAEGQRRYVESLSTYARQFIEQLSKPELDSIDGLSPTIAIEQRTTSRNPRSTVGTITEIHDYLRLLYARISNPFCYSCGKAIRSQTQRQIADRILAHPEGARVSLLAPIVRGRKGEYQKELLQLRQRGFVRARIDGEIRDLAESIHLDRQKKHDISVYVDRVILRPDSDGALQARISEAVELALKLADGLIAVEVGSGASATETLLSERFACADCDVSYPSPEPRSFSFNSPLGACPECDGIGHLGARTEGDVDEEGNEFLSKPLITCPACRGTRLRRESLCFRVGRWSIAEISALPASDALAAIHSLQLTERESRIAGKVVKEISDRLEFLGNVGLDYLALDRSADTLSGGEAQRIRLATQIGSALTGVIYVLDEPSIGLHQRDNDRLISTLASLRDRGNSILVVEHDRDTMEKADWIIDLGPGAGVKGGEIVAQGSFKEISSSRTGLTARYLRGDLAIPLPERRRRPVPGRFIRLHGARANNLKTIDVQIPLGVFCCVTGVSGSGKSTLVLDTLYRALLSSVYGVDAGDPLVDRIEGLDLVDKVVDIDQRPIGRTPRSNPATYTGLFSLIRDLFARLPESQVRGYLPGRFSFNVAGGRCEACEGGGQRKVVMHFLPDVYVRCEECGGHRFHRETLEVLYKGKSIADVLEMTASEALPFFSAVPKIRSKLTTLDEVGLGYLQLGQSATTLSGGEAQRIKLTRELSRRATGKTVYILDEPSTGLHFDDVKKLLDLLGRLVEQGNSVIVIEHNLDIIKIADHVIDLGPAGGSAGGNVVAAGTPEEIAREPLSETGKYLRRYLQ